MLKTYRVIQGVVAFLLIAVAGFLLSMENADESARQKTTVRNWEIAGRFFLDDPYNREIIAKVEENRRNLVSTLNETADLVFGLTRERGFVQEVLDFVMTKKMTGMEQVVRARFGTNFYFRDFCVVDPTNRLVYKWGAKNAQARFVYFEDPLQVIYQEGDITFLTRYRDESIDADLEIFVVFAGELIQKQLREFNFPAFFSVDGGIYSSVGGVPEDIRRLLSTTSNRTRTSQGFDVFESVPVLWQKTAIGNLGMIYPARSFSSYLILILKLIGVVLILVILIAIDRGLVKWIRENEGVRTQRKRPGGGKGKKEEPMDEKHLDWIENYIQGSEDKK